jgi:hypothetical protein
LAHPGAPARWPAAVSPLTADVLQAEPSRARVLAAFPTALYLHLPERHEAVLPVLASDALRLPTGLRLGQPSAAVRWGVEPGDEVLVGAGHVHLPGTEVVAVRAWRPARVPDPAGPGEPASPAALAVAREVLEGPTAGAVLRELTRELVAAALPPCGDVATRVARLVRGLLGAGRGLTPSGDDALCGVLLGLRAAGAPQPAVQDVACAVRHGLPSTTSLSASLLCAAAEGYAVPEVAALVRAVPAGAAADLHHALPQVLAIGHSSGADLLAGLAGTLDALCRGDLPLSDNPHPQPEGARRD